LQGWNRGQFSASKTRSWLAGSEARSVAGFPFHAPLLVAFARRAKFRRELPMRSKRQEARRLFAPEAAQDLPDRAGQIVVPEGRECAAEVRERVLVRFEKRLLRRARIIT
jgi:hypothetical protein